MRTMFGAILVAMGMIAAANAQTNQPPSHAPTARSPLFGSDWARPFPETGGYFYNDPPPTQFKPAAEAGRLSGRTCVLGNLGDHRFDHLGGRLRLLGASPPFGSSTSPPFATQS